MLFMALALAFVPSCADPIEPARQQQAGMARAPSSGPARLQLGDLPRVPLTAGEVMVRGGWGARAGTFGRRERASRPGPMALDADSRGRVSILDQVNRRVVRYDARGRLLGVIPLTGRGAATAEYLVSGDRDDLRVLALEPGRPGRYWLHHLDAHGAPRAAVRLDRSITLPTGLFLERTGETTSVWVEQRHQWQTRISHGAPRLHHAGSGGAEGRRVRALGRPDPSRPGTRALARRAGPREVEVSRVHQGRYTSVLFSVLTPLPLLAIQELAVDRRGVVYLALLLGRESGPPRWDMVESRRVMLVYRGGAGGHRVIELEQGMVTECNRDLTVSAEGEVYQLFTTEQELRVRRWRLAR